ncbi:G2/mitotic-specific cyclin-B2-like [Perca flavescens]|uniref:G2/mitotic-specific cyclin-B2-like n=1 Tax=Perca flavescens TaxID=8167 RepID=UPI00106EFEDF|nr:G2/mitotic-specific cyclin-B2-like [Perca flavescens]
MQGYPITQHTKAVLINWLVQVHSRFELLQETLYLTVAVLDPFLQVQPVTRRNLQLVGVTAMLVACKPEEMSIPTVREMEGASASSKVTSAYPLNRAYHRFPLLPAGRSGTRDADRVVVAPPPPPGPFSWTCRTLKRRRT